MREPNAREVTPVHARVSRFTGSPDQVEEAIRVTKEQITPAAKQIAGYKGVLYLVDREAGNAMAVTLWESEEAMKASEEAADKLRAEGTQAIGGEIVGVERYEVAVQEMT